MKSPFPDFNTREINIKYDGQTYCLREPTGADLEFSQIHLKKIQQTPIRISMLLVALIIQDEQKRPLFQLGGLNEEEQNKEINKILDILVSLPAPFCRDLIDGAQKISGLTESHQEKIKN